MRHAPLFASLLLVACSSSGDDVAGPKATPSSTGDPAAPPPAAADDTWADGKTVSGKVTIPAGSTVTIAQGASIAVASGASITVQGKLVASGGKIGGATWKGIVVAAGGDAELDALDVSGADVALDVSGTATFSNAAIAGTPFRVEKGGKLTASHVKVTAPDASTDVYGAFTASYLTYDENDQHAIMAKDPSATVSIEDSTFSNSGRLGASAGPDVLTVEQAASFHIAYSDVSGAHCGFHFTGGDAISIDHVTVHDITNAADVWGSAPSGKHTITASNFEKALGVAFDESGTNGAFAVTGCYVQGTNNLASPSQITIASPASAAIADAHPR
ncbi:MAG TPA: hypothetical protein VIF62_09535 [Labilithrix sp.]